MAPDPECDHAGKGVDVKDKDGNVIGWRCYGCGHEEIYR